MLDVFIIHEGFGDSKHLGELRSDENNTTKKFALHSFQISDDKIIRKKVKAGISIGANRINWRYYNIECPKSFRMLKE